MPSSYETKRQHTIDLYNRSVDLMRSIRRLPENSGNRRDRALAKYYNRLRRDVLILLGNSDRVQLIPGPVWYLEAWHLVVLVSALGITIAVIGLMATEALSIYIYILLMLLLFGMIFTSLSAGTVWWWKASPLRKAHEHAARIHSFLGDYLQEQYPELIPASAPTKRAPTKNSSVDRTRYVQRLSELRGQYDALSRRIRDLDRDIGISTDNFGKGALVEQRDQLIN